MLASDPEGNRIYEQQITLWIAVNGQTAFGEFVHEKRINQGMSVKELSGVAGVSKNTITRIESGEAILKRTLVKVSRALKVTPADFVITKYGPIQDVQLGRADQLKWHDIHFNVIDFVGLPNPSKPPNAFTQNGFANLGEYGERLFTQQYMFLIEPSIHRSHVGFELLMVLRGKVRVVFDEKMCDLSENDILSFDPTYQHHYEPIGGPCLILCSVYEIAERSMGW